MVGRSLIRTGQIVFLIDTQAGNLRLIPAETHDVEGGPYPETWEYRLTLGGPSRTVTYDIVPAASVLHFRYAASAARPWSGNGPVQVAALAGKLSAETVRALADESSGPVGRLLGIPSDGGDATVAGLKQDIANARGRTAMIEIGDWGNAGGDAKVDLQSKRFGAEPPASLVELVDVSSREIYAACGFNGALWGGSSSAAVREAWRLALFGVLSPLGKLVEAELRAKLLVTTNLPFDEWTEVFGSERLTGALLDRLTHHVHILEMNGESYRLKRSRENAAAQAPDESDNP